MTGSYALISASHVSGLSLWFCETGWRGIYLSPKLEWKSSCLFLTSAAVTGMDCNCNSSRLPQALFIRVSSICVHVWRPEERIRCPCLSFSACFVEARSLFEPEAHTFLDRLGTIKPQKFFCLCLPWSWSYRHVQDDWHVMWVLELELWSPWLQGKCDKFWTTSSAFQSLYF